MGPWEKYGGTSAPQPMTVGTPRPEKPEVREVGGSLGLVDPNTGGFTPTYTPPEKPKDEDKDPKITGDERTAAFLATRVGGGMWDIQQALVDHPGDEKPGIIASVLGSVSDDARNLANSEGRQRIEAAQMDVLDAALTLGTGAAYSPEQLRGYTRSYFPQIGDDEKTIADKQQRLRRLFESAKIKAGASAPQIDEALALLGGGPANPNGAPLQKGEFVRDGQTFYRDPDTGEETPVLIGRMGLTPEQQAMVNARVAKDGATGAAGLGAVDAATLGFSDELSAGSQAIHDSLSGKGSFGDLYNQNVAVERALKEQFGSEHPFAYTGGQIGGGFLIPAGVGGGVGRLALTGAAQGGAYGLGSGEGGLVDRLPTAATGALLGGAVGAGLGAVAPAAENALLRFSNRPSATARAQEAANALPVIQAAERQGLSLRQPDVRPGKRGDMAAVEKSPSAGPMVGDTLRADREALANRVLEVGPAGEARDPYSLGNQVQDAVNRHGARTRDEATVGYQRAKMFAAGHKADPAPVFSAIDNRVAELAANGETANAAEIKVLEGIKADLSKSGLTIESLQTQRRAMRQRLKDNGIDFGSADASYMEVLDTAGKQLENSLSGNPRAQNALRSANEKWAERSSFRKEVARQFIGTKGAPVSPETAAARFLSMAKEKGDYNRFSRMFNEMDAIEKSDFGATIAEGLGKTKSGEFQYGRFVSDLEGMNPRALRDLFGKDGADAMNDLKLIARRKSETAAGLNHSNTGSIIARSNGFKDLILAAFGGGLAGIPGAIAGGLSRGVLERFSSKRAARMLLNPDFTKWLKNTPATTKPKVINEHFARLAKVAARDTVFAADVKALQQLLADSFSRAPIRAAAAEKEDQ